MNKEQIEMLLLAADVFVERLTEGETICEHLDEQWDEDAEMGHQQALLDAIEALRARLSDYE